MKKALRKVVTKKTSQASPGFIIDEGSSIEFQLVKQAFIDNKRKKKKEKKERKKSKSKQDKSSTPWLEFPDEVLGHILASLPAGDLLRAQQISKRFYSTIEGEYLWKVSCSLRFACVNKAETMSWKEFYLAQQMILSMLQSADEQEGTNHVLCWAAYNHHTKLFKECAVTSDENSLYQGLLMACISGAQDIVEHLIDHRGLDVNEEFKIYSSMRCAGPLVATLGAVVDPPQARLPALQCTFNPAEIACLLGHAELLDLLLSRNAQLRFTAGTVEDEPPPNRHGHKKNVHLFPSVLQGALKHGKPEIVEKLSRIHGDKFNLHDEGLKQAALGNEGSLRFLLQHKVVFQAADLSTIIEHNYPDECFALLWDKLEGDMFASETITDLFKRAASRHRWSIVRSLKVEFIPLQPEAQPWREDEQPVMVEQQVKSASCEKLCEILTGPDADEHVELRRAFLFSAADRAESVLSTLLGMYHSEGLPKGVAGELRSRKERIVGLLYEWLSAYPEDLVRPAFQAAIKEFIEAASIDFPEAASFAERWSAITTNGGQEVEGKEKEKEKEREGMRQKGEVEKKKEKNGNKKQKNKKEKEAKKKKKSKNEKVHKKEEQEKEKEKERENGGQDQSKQVMEAPTLPRHLFSPLFSLMDLPAEELARQITVHHAQQFKALHGQAREFGPHTPWSRTRGASLVRQSILSFNRLDGYLAEFILSEIDSGLRAKRYEKVMRLAIHLLQHTNLQACMLVTAATNTPSLHRLKRTAELLDATIRHDFEEVCLAVSSTASFQETRRRVSVAREAHQPHIPNLGMILMDLTFIEEGNPDYHAGLNAGKLNRMWQVVADVHNINLGFPFVAVPCIQDMLSTLATCYDEPELYAMSMQIEPRQ